MNFFEAQDNARRKTWQLVALFIAAVITLIVLTNLLVAVVVQMMGGGVISGNGVGFLQSIPLESWLYVSIGVSLIVGLASAFKFVAVRGGGRAVAESLGGVRIQSNTTELRERRLLNVVEEMAIAAGIAVPPVYLLPEAGINAFAAGYTPDDAVIGVTTGTLEFLNREELQGVVAHEFSHILNGDTRINIRLIAILHGILFIGLIGNMILRGSRYSAVSSRRDSGGGAMAMILAGAGLAIIGYAGTFFGNIIKAAVSRQREYLADAAAVQYTRNPQGIGGALQKIGSAGSIVAGPQASEISHMFFGEAIHHRLSSLMATHPPLPARITAIDPTWNGNFPQTLNAQTVTHLPPTSAGFAQGGIQGVTLNVEGLTEMVGRPDHQSWQTADAIIETSNLVCLDAARDPCSSHLLVYALLMQDFATHTGTDTGKEAQVTYYPAGLNERARRSVKELQSQLTNSDDLHRLALLELAVPGLKQMSKPQYKHFISEVVKLIKADDKIELFEWVLHRVLLKELRPHFDNPKPPRVRFAKLEELESEAQRLLNVLATQGHDDPDIAAEAFALGLATAGMTSSSGQEWQLDVDPNFSNLNAALKQLRLLKPLEKPRLLKGCAATVLFDGKINANEAALLQGISAALDCPLPPSVVAKPRITQ